MRAEMSYTAQRFPAIKDSTLKLVNTVTSTPSPPPGHTLPKLTTRPLMGRMGRFARPAFEQAVRLVRESSDWNPPLKAAAGGVACILEQARVRIPALIPDVA